MNNYLSCKIVYIFISKHKIFTIPHGLLGDMVCRWFSHFTQFPLNTSLICQVLIHCNNHLGRQSERKWFMPAFGVRNMISCVFFIETGGGMYHVDTANHMYFATDNIYNKMPIVILMIVCNCICAWYSSNSPWSNLIIELIYTWWVEEICIYFTAKHR